MVDNIAIGTGTIPLMAPPAVTPAPVPAALMPKKAKAIE